MAQTTAKNVQKSDVFSLTETSVWATDLRLLHMVAHPRRSICQSLSHVVQKLCPVAQGGTLAGIT